MKLPKIINLLGAVFTIAALFLFETFLLTEEYQDWRVFAVFGVVGMAIFLIYVEIPYLAGKQDFEADNIKNSVVVLFLWYGATIFWIRFAPVLGVYHDNKWFSPVMSILILLTLIKAMLIQKTIWMRKELIAGQESQEEEELEKDSKIKELENSIKALKAQLADKDEEIARLENEADSIGSAKQELEDKRVDQETYIKYLEKENSRYEEGLNWPVKKHRKLYKVSFDKETGRYGFEQKLIAEFHPEYRDYALKGANKKLPITIESK